tara:strand:+ start:851 stop:1330 length:480 start_codon:yes stop_codon:yes gene_type:complete
MKEIQLTQGKVAIVDDDMFDFLNQWKWHIYKQNRNNYYARRTIRVNNKQKHIVMHRLIIKCEGKIIDHISGNGLDNRRCNIRVCNKSENPINRRININNLSGYKGVSWFKSCKKWRAQIQYKKIVYFLGTYEKRIDAARAYNAAALKYHGEFANLNKID